MTFLFLEPAYVIDITDDQMAANGSTVTIECTAGGSPSDFTYQWKRNDILITETGSTLTISSVTINDIGEYNCTPSNLWGNTNSSFTILSVNGKYVFVVTIAVPYVEITQFFLININRFTIYFYKVMI